MVIKMSETVEAINDYVCDFTDDKIKYVYDYVCDSSLNFKMSFGDFKKKYFSNDRLIEHLLNNVHVLESFEDLICQGITEVLHNQDIDDSDIQAVYSQEFYVG